MFKKIDLPRPTEKRWTSAKKNAVVEAIINKQITTHEACERYNMNPEELYLWAERAKRFGQTGLRATKTQHYASLSRI